MTDKNIPLAALIASSLFLSNALPSPAQSPSSPVALAFNIHDDLLLCYTNLNKTAETEAEYRWLLAARPDKGPYHFNYARLLQRDGKAILALSEYQKAASCDPSNVDFVGSYGQMLFFMHRYKEAYQYLGRAVQMPGGEKYKGSFDNLRDYLQKIQIQMQDSQMEKNAGPKGNHGPDRPKDDDDD